jgi:cytochrome b
LDASSKTAPAEVAKTRVWDLPTRLFHWSLAVCLITTYVTGRIGGNAMDWHMRGGFTVLALVLFRIVWGFIGGHHARFANFVRGPAVVMEYLRTIRTGIHRPTAGHNPAGALSVLALLALLLAQAGLGLFANDDIATEGPLAKFVSDSTSSLLTQLHRINANVLLGLVALHLAAIAFYFFRKGENLIAPMIFGDKHGMIATPSEDALAIRLRALIVLAFIGGLVYYVVTQ